jgi:hypothetical protein
MRERRRFQAMISIASSAKRNFAENIQKPATTCRLQHIGDEQAKTRESTEYGIWTQVANRFIWFVDFHGSYKLGESQESTCIHPDSTPKRKWLRRSGGNSQANKPSGPRIQNKSSVLVEENESFVSYDPIS